MINTATVGDGDGDNRRRVSRNWHGCHVRCPLVSVEVPQTRGAARVRVPASRRMWAVMERRSRVCRPLFEADVMQIRRAARGGVPALQLATQSCLSPFVRRELWKSLLGHVRRGVSFSGGNC